MVIDHKTAVNVTTGIPITGRALDISKQDGNLFSCGSNLAGNAITKPFTFFCSHVYPLNRDLVKLLSG